MLPTQSLLTLSPIALTADNVISGLVGAIITLSIVTGVSIGYFLAIYAPKIDE